MKYSGYNLYLNICCFKSGYAGTRQVLKGLYQKCEEMGVRILTGIEVSGYDVQGGRVTGVITSKRNRVTS